MTDPVDTDALNTRGLRNQASNIRADATEAEQDWLEVADTLEAAADEVDRLREQGEQLRVVRALAERADLDTDTLRSLIIEAADHPGFVPRLPDFADLLDRTEAARRALIRDNNDSDDAGIRWFTEAHRLRAVIDDAPHQEWCPIYPASVNDKPGKCDCWKADAL